MTSDIFALKVTLLIIAIIDKTFYETFNLYNINTIEKIPRGN